MTPAFLRFWAAWPRSQRKVARLQCWSKWRTRECEAQASYIMAALEAAKSSPDWRKDGGAYIPAPLVWLNQCRWEAFEPADLFSAPDEDEAAKTRRLIDSMRLTDAQRAAADEARRRIMQQRGTNG